jgi:hypothetical protein
MNYELALRDAQVIFALSDGRKKEQTIELKR